MAINSTVERLNDVKLRLTIEVSADVVAAEFNRALATLSSRVNLPGFRKGKVPKDIIAAKYGRDLANDVREQLVQRGYGEAVTTHSLTPLVSPGLTALPPILVGQPFVYAVDVEVRPELTVTGYKGVAVKSGAAEVSETEIDEQVEQLRRRESTLTPVEGRDTAEAGDVATVDINGTVDGAPVPGADAQDATFELDTARDMRLPYSALRDGLLGTKVGETKTLDVTYPTDFADASLAGRTAAFTVTVKSLATRQLPDLNDEFAKDVSDQHETLADLRASIRADLEKTRKENAEGTLKRRITRAIAQANPFTVPVAYWGRRTDLMIRQMLGVGEDADLAEATGKMGLDLNSLRRSAAPASLLSVQRTLLCEAIAKQEMFTVTADEVQAKIGEIAASMGQPVARVAQFFARIGDAGVRADILEDKTMDFLVANAVIETVDEATLTALDEADDKALFEETDKLLTDLAAS
jgi:trigger factor